MRARAVVAVAAVGLLTLLALVGAVDAAAELWLEEDTGNVQFGASRDVNLYRASTGVLKTDSAFVVNDVITAKAGVRSSYYLMATYNRTGEAGVQVIARAVPTPVLFNDVLFADTTFGLVRDPVNGTFSTLTAPVFGWYHVSASAVWSAPVPATSDAQMRVSQSSLPGVPQFTTQSSTIGSHTTCSAEVILNAGETFKVEVWHSHTDPLILGVTRRRLAVRLVTRL